MQMVSFSPQISREKTLAHSWKCYLLQSERDMAVNEIGLRKKNHTDISMRSNLRKLSFDGGELEWGCYTRILK